MATNEVATLDYTESPVVEVLLIGFHHQKGSVVEYAYPPLGRRGSDPAGLPPQWKPLPHAALPDGCHNYAEGHVTFCLPAVDSDETLHCVSCYRQISSDDLSPELITDGEITRSTVQKSVTVICKWPLYDFLKSKLQLITQSYFNSQNFSDHYLINQTYDNLNSLLTSEHALKVCCHSDLLPRQLSAYKHRLLQLFKAILLEKRVMIYGHNPTEVSTLVTSLGSLLPFYYESLINSSSFPNEQGLPLVTFPSHTGFQPYLSLQQMESVTRDDGGRGFLVGVANPLYYKQSRQYCDVCFSTVSKSLEIYDDNEGHGLSECLRLSSPDLRFCDSLDRGVGMVDDWSHDNAKPSNWTGSHEWIQAHFRSYLLSLLSTTLGGDSYGFDDHNSQFVKSFMKTSSYSKWAESPRDLGAEPHHVCEGDLTLSDLKRRLIVQADEYGIVNQEKVDELVQRTETLLVSTRAQVQSAVSNLWEKTSSLVINWWSGQDDSNNSEDDDG